MLSTNVFHRNELMWHFLHHFLGITLLCVQVTCLLIKFCRLCYLIWELFTYDSRDLVYYFLLSYLSIFKYSWEESVLVACMIEFSDLMTREIYLFTHLNYQVFRLYYLYSIFLFLGICTKTRINYQHIKYKPYQTHTIQVFKTPHYNHHFWSTN